MSFHHTCGKPDGGACEARLVLSKIILLKSKFGNFPSHRKWSPEYGRCPLALLLFLVGVEVLAVAIQHHTDGRSWACLHTINAQDAVDEIRLTLARPLQRYVLSGLANMDFPRSYEELDSGSVFVPRKRTVAVQNRKPL